MTATLAEMVNDPMLFFEQGLSIRTPSGIQLWGNVMAPPQRKFLKAISPSLLAMTRCQVPPIARFWFEGVKGWGKTQLGSAVNLYGQAFSPGPFCGEIGAKDKDQAGESLDTTDEFLRFSPLLRDRIVLHSWCILNPHTGGRTDVLASDGMGAHGSRPWFTWIDELVHHVNDDFASTMLDNGVKVPFNLSLITTNAGWTDTWQHKWREQYRTDPDAWFDAVTEPPPWQDKKAQAAAEKRNTASRQMRLHQGIWVADTGDCAINDADLQAAITQDGPIKNPEWDRYSYLGGLDLAYRRDHCGFVVWASDHHLHRVRLAHVREWSPVAGCDIDLRSVKEDIEDARRRFGLQWVLVDPSQAVLMGQLLSEQQIYLYPVPQAGKEAASRAMALVDAFKTRIVDLYDYAPLIRDLKKLRTVERNNSVRLEAAADEHGHADTAFAASFALQAAVENCHKRLVPWNEDCVIDIARI